MKIIVKIFVALIVLVMTFVVICSMGIKFNFFFDKDVSEMVSVYSNSCFDIEEDYFSYGEPGEGRKMYKAYWTVQNDSIYTVEYLELTKKIYDNGVCIRDFEGSSQYDVSPKSSLKIPVLFTIDERFDEDEIVEILNDCEFEYFFYFEGKEGRISQWTIREKDNTGDGSLCSDEK